MAAADTEYQSLTKLADDLNIRKDVEFLSSVPEKDLVDVYNSFDAYVVPSEWEGFGLPILEAQRCRIPVVIRADAHIPEEVGRHCLKATSARHMADILYEILEDDTLRGRVARTGLEYSKRFRWENNNKADHRSIQGFTHSELSHPKSRDSGALTRSCW